MVSNKFLVVVSVHSGRDFPKRPRHLLTIECKLDGELLSTDPVEHSENPEIIQELAWEQDKKRLHQNRVQRAQIKAQIYAVDKSTSAREVVGYVMLDLRAATNKQSPRLYPLLHCKYKKTKPKIQIGIYIDDDQVPTHDSAHPRTNPLPTSMLKPVLHSSGTYYQIGPAESCREVFLLSVTLAFAENLMQLLPNNASPPQSSSGFFVYYSLLGNDVTTEPFFDLANPKFPAERASVRLRSSMDVLQQFFAAQPGITFYLCFGNESLGSCQISLDDLLKSGSTEIFMKPISKEGAFKIIPPSSVQKNLPEFADNLSPVLGLAIGLRVDKDDQSKDTATSPETTSSRDDVPKTSAAGKPISPTKASSADNPNKEELLSKAVMSAEKLLESAKKTMAEQSPPKKKKEQTRDPPPPPPISSINREVEGTDQPAGSPKPLRVHYDVPLDQFRQFSFCLHLKKLRNVVSVVPLNAFLRYQYTFFGSTSPVSTYPSVQVNRGAEVTLPNSYCVIDFVTNLSQVDNSFNKTPLAIEVWHRDKQLSSDVLFAVGDLWMNKILLADKYEIDLQGSTRGYRQQLSMVVPANSVEGADRGKHVADIVLDVALEVRGVVDQRLYAPKLTPKKTKSDTGGGDTLRNTKEYKAAVELELWKDAQEKLFDANLKKKEDELVATLTNEYKKREIEREAILTRKMSEYPKLEDKLKSTLDDLTKREAHLVIREAEVHRTQTDLRHEFDLKMKELKDASRRCEDDAMHKVHLERSKSESLQEQINSLKEQVIDWEEKYKNLQNDFTKYRSEQHSKPEVRLQAEINLLTLEKQELEKKADSLTKSKNHYKQQWGRSLKELARIKEQRQKTERDDIMAKHQELEHMRLRYLATEEQGLVSKERSEFDEIKEKLKKLELEATTKQQTPDKTKQGSTHSTPVRPTYQDHYDDHIARLIEERDTLLRTGVYSNQDRIIVELDRQIKEAISRKQS